MMAFARRIRHRAFEAVADLDPDIMLLGRHDQQQAVVLALLPDAPAAAKRNAPILDGITLQIGQGDEDELDA